jgi:Tfp pilus assembly protein PilF
MRQLSRFAAAAALGTALSLLQGCSSGSLWGNRSSDGTSVGSGQSSTTAGITGGRAWASASGPQPNGVSAGKGSWWDGLKTKVSDSMAAKPKVIPANDPARLDSAPTQLSPAVFVQAAGLAESQGNLDAAQKQLEKALELNPNDVQTLVVCARFQDRRGRSEQALGLYQRARRAAPNSALVCNDLGLCYARRGEYRPAVSALEQAVALEPNNPRYRNNLATVLVEIGRADDAVTALKAVHPPAIAYHNVGYLLYMRQRTAASAKYFDEALRRDPSFAPARTMLAQLTPDRSLSAALPAAPPAGVPAEPVSFAPPKNSEGPAQPRDDRVWTPTRRVSEDEAGAGLREAGELRENFGLRKMPPVF